MRQICRTERELLIPKLVILPEQPSVLATELTHSIWKLVDKAGQFWQKNAKCPWSSCIELHWSYVPCLFAVYPKFIVRPKNTTALVNQQIWLHCNASGDPKPKISWSKEEAFGYQLDPERFIQHPNGTLHIKKVQLTDKGRYYCIAANHAEMKQSKFTLDVEGKLK